jgi:hypothetical protein
MVDSASRAALDVLRERLRQQTEEGWTPEHDDRHSDGSLARAAASYAYAATLPDKARKYVSGIYSLRNSFVLDELWPDSWDSKWWKPKDRRRDLVRAAALIIAEIERLDRLEAKERTNAESRRPRKEISHVCADSVVAEEVARAALKAQEDEG